MKVPREFPKNTESSGVKAPLLNTDRRYSVNVYNEYAYIKCPPREGNES